VSVVGTLWRDGDHNGNPYDRERLRNARSCWRGPSSQDYWTEMHTPDKVRKLPQKPVELSQSLLGYMACNRMWFDSYRLRDDVTLPRPPGWEHASIASISSALSGQYYLMEPPTFAGTQVSVRGEIANMGGCVQAFYKVNWGCDPGWRHCDSDPNHNCETQLGTDANCAYCGNACSVGQHCISGTCQVPPTCNSTTCPSPDPAHHVIQQHCQTPYVCQIDLCTTGWAHCDGQSFNGCETQLGTDTNCASCGNVCSGGQWCIGGQCQTPCPFCGGVECCLPDHCRTNPDGVTYCSLN
jgi:hypothetical protein